MYQLFDNKDYQKALVKAACKPKPAAMSTKHAEAFEVVSSELKTS
jgi:hypothetical protein